MAIKDTYSELILEQIIRDLLLEGINPSASEIENRFNTFIADNDLSKPLFKSTDYDVEFGEVSSASKFNNTLSTVHKDLKVLYKHLYVVSDKSIKSFERWRNEARLLEGRLTNLEDRINSLLLVSKDTAGYLNFFQDNFTDLLKTDLANSTAHVDTDKGIVTLGTSDPGATRIDLSGLRNSDLEFIVLTRNNLASTVSAAGSQLKYAISDLTNYWQEIVYMNKPVPVSAELKVKFPSTQHITRIDIDLHTSNTNSAIQITPMYSMDNYNYSQLPITNFTRSIADRATFQFSEIEANFIKFVMTKIGYDGVRDSQYSYEFGVDEILFFREGFSTETSSTFYSQALSIKNGQGIVQQFSKVVLEVCEDVPDETSIDYSVTVSVDENSFSGTYASIDPINRTNPTQPISLDFGDLDSIEVSGVTVSYDNTIDPSGTTGGVSNLEFINPAQDYTIVDSISNATPITKSAIASRQRYSFFNSNDRILSHTLNDTNIELAENTLEVWRNVNTQGSNTKVRGYSNGWGFIEPYYVTTVYVGSPSGVDIDFGGETVVVDNVPQKGVVSFAQGNHTVWVHKNNWKAIDTTSVTDLDTLKLADSLYPYNHRYLVEGLLYPAAYSTSDPQIYRGFDIVAEFLMQEVSIFDIIHNVPTDDYKKFAIDRDVRDPTALIDSVSTDKDSMNVFVLKVDESKTDFVNEKFLLKFKSANTLYKYLKLKAVFSTQNANIAPYLDSYRIKLSS